VLIKLLVSAQGNTLMDKAMGSLMKNHQGGTIDDAINFGLLRLLVIWMDESPKAIQTFLSNNQNIPFLVEVINQSDQNIHLQGMSALLVGLCLLNREDSNQDDHNVSY